MNGGFIKIVMVLAFIIFAAMLLPRVFEFFQDAPDNPFTPVTPTVRLGADILVCSSDKEETQLCNFVADGTDDQLVINEAISENTSVRLSCGDFVLTAPVVMESFSRIYGSGPCTELVIAEGAVSAFQAIIANAKTDIEIAYLTIDGNKDNRGVGFDDGPGVAWEGINLINTTDAYLHNLRFRDVANDSIDLDFTERVTLSNILSSGSGGAAIHPSEGSTQTTISDVITVQSGLDFGRAGIHIFEADDVVITNFFSIGDQNGVRVSDNSSSVSVSNAIVRDAVLDSIRVGGGSHTVNISNFDSHSPGRNGIRFEDADVVQNSVVNHARIFNSSGIGIRAIGSGLVISDTFVTSPDSDNWGINILGTTVTGPERKPIRLNNFTVMDTYTYGIRVDLAQSSDTIISDGFVANTRRAGGTGTARGIQVFTADRVVVQNTVSTDTRDSGSKTQRDGIVFTSGENHIVRNNDVSGNTNSSMLIGGAATIRLINNNLGFATESRGTATVTSGNTDVSVNHGLDYEPVIGDCQVTPANSLGDAETFWTANFGESTFDILVDVEPGATGAEFSWNCLTGIY